MDDTLTKDWVKTVWGKQPGGLTKRSLLVLDSFHCHKSTAVKELLRDSCKTRLATISCGNDVDPATSRRLDQQANKGDVAGEVE